MMNLITPPISLISVRNSSDDRGDSCRIPDFIINSSEKTPQHDTFKIIPLIQSTSRSGGSTPSTFNLAISDPLQNQKLSGSIWKRLDIINSSLKSGRLSQRSIKTDTNYVCQTLIYLHK